MSFCQTDTFMVASSYRSFTIIGARNSNTRELPAPVVDHLEHGLGIEPGLEAEHHRLGGWRRC